MPKTLAEKETLSLLDGWRNLFTQPLSFKERFELGKQMRAKCPRTEHGEWKPAKDRTDPVALLNSQDRGRMEQLVPVRYGRMLKSPFAFYRGAALIMASDLAPVKRTALTVQLCGDCHLSNFGVFATPERNIIFDLNDFDETLPGPFEWDLKRLAASFMIAALENGFSQKIGQRCVEAMSRTYRLNMEEYSEMSTLDVWYKRIDWHQTIDEIKRPGRKQVAYERISRLKDKRSHAAAVAKFTELVDGKRRIKDNPPLIFHSPEVTPAAVQMVLELYAESLWESRRCLLQRYRFVDVAAKVVGIGSVGNAAAIALFQGEGHQEDFIFLQLKQAVPSVLERFLGKSQFDHPGERIVNGQRLMQAASDMFLGWTSGPKRDFYIRQLMDLKDSVSVDQLDAVSFEQYAELCGRVLARAHARTGDPAMLFGYMGKSDVFDEALVSFAKAYCKQNQKDYAALVDAVKEGKVKAAFDV
jgi:uncharacterized protein (DUF2252 family)